MGQSLSQSLWSRYQDVHIKYGKGCAESLWNKSGETLTAILNFSTSSSYCHSWDALKIHYQLTFYLIMNRIPTLIKNILLQLYRLEI
jgi:hypothetical protein